jgi:hypothetical protein
MSATRSGCRGGQRRLSRFAPALTGLVTVCLDFAVDFWRRCPALARPRGSRGSGGVFGETDSRNRLDWRATLTISIAGVRSDTKHPHNTCYLGRHRSLSQRAKTRRPKIQLNARSEAVVL